MREFIWTRPNGSFDGGPASLDKLAEALRSRISSERAPFTITRDGKAIAERRTRKGAVRKFLDLLRDGAVGPVYRIRGKGGDVFFAGREVARVIETSGNDNADAFWTWVVRTFPQYAPRFAGAYVCKDVLGTSTASQHSYGNACDIFFESLAAQHAVYVAVKQGKCPVPIDLVICEDHDWSPSAGETSYGGVYHRHLHAQFRPTYSGACGVRGESG